MHAKGSKHYESRRSGMTEDKVREIRASKEAGVVLAERYGISAPMVSLIRRRKKWAHVKDAPP